MNWIQSLIATYDAYDAAGGVVGKIDEPIYSADKKKAFEPRPLLPLFHLIKGVDYIVEITADGEFSQATTTAVGNKKSIIPSDNAGKIRSSTKWYRKPYALHDKVEAIVVDDSAFKDCKGYRNMYMRAISEFVNSDIFKASPLKETEGVSAVFKYLSKGSLFDDLTKVFPDSFKYSENGEMLFPDAQMVRFNVIGMRESSPADLTKNEGVQKLYIRYMLENQSHEQSGLCYATGEYGPLLPFAEKGLFPNENGAKLLSGVDKDGFPSSGKFTFWGSYFNKSSDCAQIGEIAGQKVSSILQWLLDHQGWTPSSDTPYTIVAWDMSHTNALDARRLFADKSESVFENTDDDDFDDSDVAIPDKNAPSKKLRAYQGYYIQGISEDAERVAVAVFAAPSKGRASILYYSDMTADQFMDNAVFWHESSGWMVPTKDGLRKIAPSLYTTLRVCFGRKEKLKNGKISWKVEGAKVPVTAGILFRCFIQRMPLPYEVMSMAFQKVIHTERWASDAMGTDYKYFLHAAAGLIRKYYFDKEGKELMPYLDENNMNRDYLYGRILAVYDNIERWALNEQAKTYGGDAKNIRPTNAVKLMSEFFSKPATTTQRLNRSINPYLQRIFGKAARREALLNELIAKVSAVESGKSERELNNPVGPIGLLGYAAQMDAFDEAMKANIKNKNESEEE